MFKLEQNNGQINLLGQLDFNTVADLLKPGSVNLDFQQIDVDLSQVTRFNSASLALLLEWLKLATQKGAQIKYHNAPEQLLAIARAYGIDQELPLGVSE